MIPGVPRYRSRLATVLFDVLNPAPYGFFVATLIFDIIFACNADVLWAKGAAWLVSIGLVVAIVPRLINLGHVWFSSRYRAMRHEKLDFWLNLLAIVIEIGNAFVHSRDAYAIVPENIILSLLGVLLLVLAQLLVAYHKFAVQEQAHA